MPKELSQGRANARMRQLVQYVHEQVDREHERPDKRLSPNGAAVQCTTGCSHAATGCCSLIVLLESTEAEYIVARNADAVRKALPRLLENEQHIRDAGIGPAEIDGMFRSHAVEADVAHRFHALQLPCALLDLETRHCTIYRDRPLACRTHFVLSEPASCSVLGVNEQHAILDKGTRIGGQAFLIQEVARERGGKVEFGLLNGLVLVAVGRERGYSSEAG